MSYLERFHYQITGNPDGNKLVFLHGLMGAGQNWRPIARLFEPQFHILTFDQRGHGRSFHAENAYHPRDFAGDLRHILDELGWASVTLVGHSMGGRNALEFAHLFPSRVRALVLEDIAPDANWTAVDRIARLLAAVPTPFANRAEMRAFFETEYAKRIAWYPQPEVIARFLQTNMIEKPDGTYDWRFDRAGIFRSMEEGRREDRWDALRNLKMPTLIVRGGDSQDLTPELFAQMRRELPTAEAVEIPGAGHWVHADQPEAFARALSAFFQAHLGRNL